MCYIGITTIHFDFHNVLDRSSCSVPVTAEIANIFFLYFVCFFV